ncbi:MAG: SufD family Fe-S cluster assembly protein [Lachnospiraceae bacterium]|nr:SufD family Fe-S cluster assembly protein [Lachnospiraceae bacterium]
MDQIQLTLLEEIAGLHEVPQGAYNIRINGATDSRSTTENIDIVTKTDVSGIDIYVKPGTKKESLHIPVLLSQTGLKETVYNDFHIGDDCDITIVAGCGIHNGGSAASEHSGIHSFFVGKNSKVRYVEKHYGSGDGNGERIMNPTTVVHLEEGATMEMEMVQIKGVDSTIRNNTGDLKAGASLTIKESLMTHGKQSAESNFRIEMNGEDSHVNLISRSVARDTSHQIFRSEIVGNAKCTGHSECDAIIMDKASVSAIPELTANNLDSELIHEAAIGKIAGEQITKLMTLGLSEEEAEEQIINGFLK